MGFCIKCAVAASINQIWLRRTIPLVARRQQVHSGLTVFNRVQYIIITLNLHLPPTSLEILTYFFFFEIAFELFYVSFFFRLI